MNFWDFFKAVFVSKFWIKAICLLLSVFVVLTLNV